MGAGNPVLACGGVGIAEIETMAPCQGHKPVPAALPGNHDWPVDITAPPAAQAAQALDISHVVTSGLRRAACAGTSPLSVHYYFAQLYHCAVVRNLSRVDQVRRPDFLRRLIAEFYRLYFESCVARAGDRRDCRRTPLWDAYFDIARSLDGGPSSIGLFRLVEAGVRAHVVGDMAEALVAAAGAMQHRGIPDDIAEDLFGHGSDRLYFSVLADFADAVAPLPGPLPRAMRAPLWRTAGRLLQPVLVAKLQRWRRAALDEARMAFQAGVVCGAGSGRPGESMQWASDAGCRAAVRGFGR